MASLAWVVRYHPPQVDGKDVVPLAAIVTREHGDGTVSLVVFAPNQPMLEIERVPEDHLSPP